MYVISDGDVPALLPKAGPNGLGFLGNLLHYGSSQTDAPLIFHVASGLALLSAAVPAGLGYWAFGSPMYPNLYILIIGSSGAARKTISMKIGKGLLKKAMPKKMKDMPDSIQALLQDMQECPQQIIFDEDMARFLKESKGNGFRSPLKQGLMSIFDGSDTSKKSISGGNIEVIDPRLTLYAAVNMTELSEHIDLGDLSSGFLSRFLFLTGRRERYLRFRDTKRNDDWFRYLAGRLQLIHELCPSGMAKFDMDAEDALDEWEASNDLQVRTSDDSQEVSLLSRIPEFTRKVALLYAVDRLSTSWTADTDREETRNQQITVTLDDVSPAIALAQIAFRSVRQVHGNLHTTPAMRDRAKVVEAMPIGVPMTVGEICRGAKMLRSDLTRFLDTLVEEKTISAVVIQDGKGYVRTEAKPKAPKAPALPVAVQTSVAAAPRIETVGDHYHNDDDEPSFGRPDYIDPND